MFEGISFGIFRIFFYGYCYIVYLCWILFLLGLGSIDFFCFQCNQDINWL